MRATIKMIAEQAGVSIGTVDRVLHNRPYVKPEVRERVLQVMEELDYRPNRMASALALSGTSRRFAVVQPAWEGYVGEAIAAGVAKFREERRDYNLTVTVRSYRQGRTAECLRHLDIFPEYNYQSRQYQSGIYNGCIHTALINRKKIQHILNRTDTESGSDTDSFFPVQVYCPSCGKDTCTVLAYEEEKKDICFRCSCGYSGVYNIEKNFRGKLQWKINWAVRWHMDGVCAEASGENHLCKNGSFHAASRICQEIFGETPPLNIEYKFIGIPGSAKVSGQMGTPVLARTLIDILEPALLRWLLLIHSPDKAFKIDITNGIFALYREWDLFCANVMLTESDSLQRRIYTIASGSSEYHYCGASFSQLVTAVMCSGGDKARALAFSFRISGVTQYSESYQKRFDCAWKYVTQYHPEKKVQIRQTVNMKFSAVCSQELLHAVVVFRQEVAESDCQHAVKKALASAADSVSKKELCRALYNLLISRNDGPPIDSLVSLIGKERVIKLLDI